MTSTDEWNNTMQADLSRRTTEINWPEHFDPDTADLFAHNEILIHAPADKIWKHLIEAGQWPVWYPNSKDVEILADAKVLSGDTTFRWQTFGLNLESRVNEYVPHSRLSWFGYTPGSQPNFYHTWFIVPKGDDCMVVTEEVGIGSDAAALRQHNEGLLHRGHDLWLATLRWMAEYNA